MSSARPKRKASQHRAWMEDASDDEAGGNEAPRRPAEDEEFFSAEEDAEESEEMPASDAEGAGDQP